jgi:hypothetical protein
MAEKSFAAALNEQIANEFGAQQQYTGALADRVSLGRVGGPLGQQPFERPRG